MLTPKYHWAFVRWYFCKKWKIRIFRLCKKKIGVKLRIRNSSLLLASASCWLFWLLFLFFYSFRSSASGSKLRVSHPSRIETSSSSASSSQTEKDYLAERFAKLKAVNSETIGYVYAPGTQLDEPVVQTKDNATYLLKTFEGKQEPYMGAVFMDKDNH